MENLQSYINQTLNNRIINENTIIKEEIENILNRINDNEFRLAVVGEFSSGKSTFINAIIGKDVLKHATVETTAIVTYIHNVKKEDNLYKKCKVTFKDGEVKILEDYSSLKEYTTTMSQNDVVNTIERVDLYFKFIDCEEKLVIVDTPGLNGIADKHRDITIDEIQRAHACIYLFQKNGITESDKEFIKFLCNYQNRFIFIQNFIDSLRRSEGEYTKEKINAIKSYIDKSIFEDNNFKINYDIFGVSALKALAGKESNIDYLYEGDLFELTDKRRSEILKESNINEVEEKIKEILDSKENIKIKAQSATHALINILEVVINKERVNQDRNVEMLKKDNLYRNKEKAKEKIELLANEESKIIEKLDAHVVSQFIRSKKLLREDIEKNITIIEERINELIDEVNDYDEFDKKYKTQYFTNELQKLIDLYRNGLEISEYSVIQQIYRSMLNRLNEYTRFSTKEIKNMNTLKFVESKVITIDLTFKEKRSVIEDLKDELYKNEINVKEESKKVNKLNSENEKVKVEESFKQNEFNSLNSKEKGEINILGMKPEKEFIGYEEVIEYVDRGGIGFMQAIFGSKKVRRNVERYSYENLKEWERKKRNIDEKYYREREKITKSIQAIKDRKVKIEDELDKSNVIFERSEKQVIYLKGQIEVKENELKMYETKAKKEYLALRKKHFTADISRYLLAGGGIQDILIIMMTNDINSNEESIREEAKRECKRYIKGEAERLNAIIEGNEEKINEKWKSNEEDIKMLNEILLKLQVR